MTKPMDKSVAINELLYQAQSGRTSYTAYKMAVRALDALDLPAEAKRKSLSRLGYVRCDNGEPYEWLAKKIAEKSNVQMLKKAVK